VVADLTPLDLRHVSRLDFPQARFGDNALIQTLRYTTFAIGVGGYVTGLIARRSRLTLAAIMGAIEVASTLYVMIDAPFHEAHTAPRWIWITGVILIIPAACIGTAIPGKQTPPTIP
jgi:hypothetical protein